MLQRHFCLAGLITVAVQVAQVHATLSTVSSSSSSSSSSSICNTAKECYVDGNASTICDRTKKKCNRCLMEYRSDTFLSSLGMWAKYQCYDVDDDGECPTGTLECPATLVSSRDDKKTENPSESESSKPPPTSDSTMTTYLLRSTGFLNSPAPTSLTTTNTTMLTSSQTNASNSSVTFDKPKIPRIKQPTEYENESSPVPPSGEDEETSDDVLVKDSTLASHESSVTSRPYEEPDSVVQNSVGNGVQKTESPDQSSVRSTVSQPAPAPVVTPTVTTDEVLSDNGRTVSTATADDAGFDGAKTCLVLGIGGLTGILALAGFVVWKKKQHDEDSDNDEDSVFSPNNKPVSSRDVGSASSATMAYVAESNRYGSKNYEHHLYSNKYGTKYDDVGQSNTYTATQYAIGGSSGDVVGIARPTYGSPYSIDIDSENHMRRKDSILGGTGVMSSTASSMHTPFEFTGGPSPANSDTSQDIWGNTVGSYRLKRSVSNVSVEF